jgi:hypothetical protein
MTIQHVSTVTAYVPVQRADMIDHYFDVLTLGIFLAGVALILYFDSGTHNQADSQIATARRPAMDVKSPVPCPTRPACPRCGMGMITTDRHGTKGGHESCTFKCLRCGHTETSKPATA